MAFSISFSGFDRFAHVKRIGLSAIMVAVWGLLGHAQADQLSIPTNLVGGSGLQAQAPVNATNATGFSSAQFRISYDPAILTAVDAQTGGLASGKSCNVEFNVPASGQAAIALFCSGQITGTGELLRITFNVVGAPNTSSALNFVPSSCVLNEGSPACTTANGSMSVVQSHTLSGKVIYYNGLATRPATAQERVIRDVAINLSGAITTSGATLANGTYSLGALQGDVTLQPRKREGYNGAITAFDAALVAQHLAGIITLNARQLIAADANGTGAVATNDASQIARFTVGSLSEMKMEADCNTAFAFVPAATSASNQTVKQPSSNVLQPPNGVGCVYGEIRYNPLVANATGQDFIAVLIGDVSGNWQPAAGALTSSALRESKTNKKRSAKVSVGKRPAKPGTIVTLPIKIANAQDVISLDLGLTYDKNVLLPLEVKQTPLSKDMTLDSNVEDDQGEISIALFGEKALNKSGTLLLVSFEVIGEQKTISPVDIDYALVNENPATTSKGHVQIK